jgi:hypothetical protein
MTWSDPIVDDVRRARDVYAARFNYDLWAIFRDLKEQEKRGGRKVVSFAEISAATEQNRYMVSKVKRAHPGTGLNKPVFFPSRCG